MSHSRKKHPFGPIACSESNKAAKRENNRRLRRKAKLILTCSSDHDAMVVPQRLDDVMNRYDYPDDGKCRYDVRRLEEGGYPPHRILAK